MDRADTRFTTPILAALAAAFVLSGIATWLGGAERGFMAAWMQNLSFTFMGVLALGGLGYLVARRLRRA